jgi:monoterpene epsilon-lactone hydrolase
MELFPLTRRPNELVELYIGFLKGLRYHHIQITTLAERYNLPFAFRFDGARTVQNLKTIVSNRILGLSWQIAFRAKYDAPTLRRNFEKISGVSAESLRKKYPQATFEAGTLGGAVVERICTVDHPERTIFYAHGGGYFMGSIASYRRIALRLAYRCRAEVILVEYPLSPNHPFPAALDELTRAYEALTKEIGGERLWIAGDSAGGGLTLALLLRLRDQKKILPKAAICLSPWADMTCTGKSLDTNRRKDFCLDRERLVTWAPRYAGSTPLDSPLVSPIFGDYAGLPPLYLMVGGDEVLKDDSVRVAERAKAAGVKVTLWVAPGMQHVWPFALPWLRESREAMRRLDDFLGETA